MPTIFTQTVHTMLSSIYLFRLLPARCDLPHGLFSKSKYGHCRLVDWEVDNVKQLYDENAYWPLSSMAVLANQPLRYLMKLKNPNNDIRCLGMPNQLGKISKMAKYADMQLQVLLNRLLLSEHII